MEALLPGHYWKTPFDWEPGCPDPIPSAALRFVEAEPLWLAQALSIVLANSLDQSDQYVVFQSGADRAAAELLAACPAHFEYNPDWWRAAIDAGGQRVGFVLPVLFRDRAKWKDGRPQGTIIYMGVLPEHRGHGCAQALLAEATRVFMAANCWRVACDTGTDNHPMVQAFRKAGCKEREPWQRPWA